MMQENSSDLERLSRLFRSGQSLIWIPTHEEREALELVRLAAVNDSREVYSWTCVQGVSQDLLEGSAGEASTENPIVGLARLGQIVRTHEEQRVSRTDRPPVVIAVDLIDHLGDQRVLRVFREILAMVEKSGGVMVLVDHQSHASAVVMARAARFELTLPDEAEIERTIRNAIKDIHIQSPIRVAIERSSFTAIVRNMRGLTRRQIARIIREACCDDRAFTKEDLPEILMAKRRMLSDDGLLESVDAPSNMDQIGGMGRLKAWLRQREGALSEEARKFGLTPPRGVLLLGVQGAGKSLCAKAIATAWQRPLVRMNVGALYDRYVGESERQLRGALKQAQAMSPVVLWIDEIEKAFASAASQSTDGGLSKRMFGELLTWMQEHQSPVFTVATANDIDALPPELLRKGRFDDIFFVDLPGDEARKTIFEIHLKKRHRKPSEFDLDRLVETSAGYSGAEIEQGVMAALHEAYAMNADLTTQMITRALEDSPPLSVTMREKIDALREWARDRCVSAE